MSPKRRTKVAILGGGTGALSTAYALAAGPDSSALDITVYQMGWRLGGKCATGRNLQPGYGKRIEEHGIHMFFGSYAETWNLLAQVYRDWARPEDHPLASLEKAFAPSPGLTLTERIDGRWVRWPLPMPRRGPDPWTLPPRPLVAPSDPTPPPAASLRWLVAFIDVLVGDARGEGGGAPARFWASARTAAQLVADTVATVLGSPRSAGEGAAAERAERQLRGIVARAGELGKGGWHVLARQAFGLAVAVARGLLRDRPRAWRDLDDVEYRTWLVTRGGLDPSLADCAMVRAVYVSGFARVDGRTPDIGAGTAISTMLRTMLGYRGACAYHFRTATGDVLMTPLYEVLRDKYGVRFELFQKVRALRLDGDVVARVEIDEQARVRTGTSYDPLVRVQGIDAWPAEPDLAQLEDGERLRGYDLESYWDESPLTRPRVLERGRDYDVLVLGMSLATLPIVARELVEKSPRWRSMVERVKTTPTCGVQIWWNAPREALGAEPAPYGDRLDVATYAAPLPLLVDFDQTLWSEAHEPDAPARHVFYLSDAWAPLPGPHPFDDRTYPARERAHLRDTVRTWMEANLAWLYPNAVRTGADGRSSIAWELLAGPSQLEGAARLDAQWFRANVDPSERYVLSATGSVAHRLKPGDSGFRGLYLTGDWTDDGLNIGCVEATVRSALLCADALRRDLAMNPKEDA